MAYQLTCVLSAPILQLPRISCRTRCEANHIFLLSGRDWHSCCLDWVWECVILKRECLWVEQINL